MLNIKSVICYYNKAPCTWKLIYFSKWDYYSFSMLALIPKTSGYYSKIFEIVHTLCMRIPSSGNLLNITDWHKCVLIGACKYTFVCPHLWGRHVDIAGCHGATANFRANDQSMTGRTVSGIHSFI